MSGTRPPMRLKGPCCPSYGKTKLCDTAAWLALIVGLFVVVTLVLLGILVFETGDSQAISRYSIQADNTICTLEVGDTDARVLGTLLLNSNSERAEWSLLTENLGIILSIHIEGPVNATYLDEGPTKLVLCGSPSTLACETTAPIEGIIYNTYDGLSIRSDLLDIQETSPLYYLVIRTADFPDCSVKSRLAASF